MDIPNMMRGRVSLLDFWLRMILKIMVDEPHMDKKDVIFGAIARAIDLGGESAMVILLCNVVHELCQCQCQCQLGGGSGKMLLFVVTNRLQNRDVHRAATRDCYRTLGS
mmetsp:Transcript_33925/g.62459  ORF Transcript_33925/g.62459 Transcript_33925/m.62459 type:complete len:109 (-) Transcript_33925:41-367(-)